MLTPEEVIKALKDETPKKVILDTDTYNEVDDQFALAYCMLSDKVDLLSVNAAPFKNHRCPDGPETGMLKSYEEIGRIMELTKPNSGIPYYKGSPMYLKDKEFPIKSDACDNIVKTVMESKETVYVIAIGAITNVASALIQEPAIKDNMVLIWLGGHAYSQMDTHEFNMRQDLLGAQIVFDCGVPLVHVPANGVTSELKISVPELKEYIGGKTPLGTYLTEIVTEYLGGDPDYFCKTKNIWDIGGVGCVAWPGCVDMAVMTKPVITAEGLYQMVPTRPSYVYVYHICRDELFRNCLSTIANG